MPPNNLPKPKPAQLRAAFKHDLAACWKLAQTLHPDYTPYAFVLYGVEGGAHFMPHVLTEESLTQVAARYLKEGNYDTLDEACKALRYSVADSPLFAELEDKLVSVDALLKPHENFLCEEEVAGYELLAKAAMTAFEQLDKEGHFGKGKRREQLMLAIITEDTEKDWANPSIKKLNPPAVFKRFEADTRIDGNWANSEAIAISSDESSLYSTGSRDINPKKDKDTSEVVAYDISGARLKRRWDFLFPRFGDSGRAIACARDGKIILVMRAKYVGEACRTLLMRFGRDKNVVVEQSQVQGEPAGFAVSKDDSRIAVTMHDKSLHILDSKFSVVQALKLPAKPGGLKFLESGDLLVATEAGIIRADRAFKLTPTPFSNAAFALAVDDAEKLLVVSRWFIQGSDDKRNVEFGIQIVRLPSLETTRTILIPGHQAVSAILTHDGKHVAFEAHKIGTYRKFIVVCETETGREIARRKCGYTNDLKFLKDNQTLAIAHSGHTATEPIDFWRVPGL